MPTNDRQKNSEYLETPVYWFVVLERARADSDFQLAADAQRQLNRLGVRVSYVRPKREAANAS